MLHTENHEPPVGGQINLPKFQRSIDRPEDFIGLSTDLDRFHILRLIKVVGKDGGFTAPMIQLLEYYMVRTQNVDWNEGQKPICYQAVGATARDLCLTERQVNNIEKALFVLGALRWEDSGNYKRFGVRDRETGEIKYAFGADLSPLEALLPRLEALIEAKSAYKDAWCGHKAQISALRRRIRTMLDEVSGDFKHVDIVKSIEEAYEAISHRIRSHYSLDDLNVLIEAHKQVIEALTPVFNDVYKEDITVNNVDRDAIYFRHIQDTNNLKSSKEDTSSNCSSSNNAVFQKSKEGNIESESLTSAPTVRSKGDEIESPTPKIDNITWKQVLNASSERFRDYIPIHDRKLQWNDLVSASEGLLQELGIHRSAWIQACATLGRSGATICIMIIDQKSLAGEIRSPGGYLREMCRRAERGELNLLASVFGLLKRGENDDDF
ncbi:MAG: hypothetical protein COB14_07565 [Alphaproteobacteria bacterium]|nr:MAG: hypothetical protein COB14_07565 [Alphaproteobacteria bacterium]